MIKTKQPKVKEEYWRQCVGTYLFFVRERYNDASIDLVGSAPRDLKNIVRMLREEAEKKKTAWTADTATRSLLYFLKYASNEPVVMDNAGWLLPSCNKYKEQILESIKQSKLQRQ
jgi:hypothetical protein